MPSDPAHVEKKPYPSLARRVLFYRFPSCVFPIFFLLGFANLLGSLGFLNGVIQPVIFLGCCLWIVAEEAKRSRGDPVVARKGTTPKYVLWYCALAACVIFDVVTTVAIPFVRLMFYGVPVYGPLWAGFLILINILAYIHFRQPLRGSLHYGLLMITTFIFGLWAVVAAWGLGYYLYFSLYPPVW